MIAKFLDWNEVPSKYKYRAVDSDGKLYYYIDKPYFKNEIWYNSNHETDVWHGIMECENPELTLEERPRPEPKVGEEVIFKLFGLWKVGSFIEIEGEIHINPLDYKVAPFKVDSDTEWKYIDEIQF